MFNAGTMRAPVVPESWRSADLQECAIKRTPGSRIHAKLQGVCVRAVMEAQKRRS